jgi:RimJ/RimL family protein N-acetyltransferase
MSSHKPPQALARTLTTPRLTLRQWRAADLEPFAALNADPAVMEFMPRPLGRAESDGFAEHAAAALEQRGWGLWAVEERQSGEFIGCVGLNAPSFHAAFTPCIEILWRLRRASWGLGFATEAARACVSLGFATLVLPEIVAFTVPANLRSRAVMERLGMSRDAGGDFDHPRLPPGHALSRHVLYRLTQSAWKL